MLSEGSVHVSDQTNASATTTGMRAVDGSEWNETVCDAFDVPRSMLPDVVDSAGVCGIATALPGAPPIAAMIGDQQASLVDLVTDDEEGTHVRFGPELGDVDDLAVVTTTYELPTGGIGRIGVMGPMRMNYRRTIRVVEQVSEKLGDGSGAEE